MNDGGVMGMGAGLLMGAFYSMGAGDTITNQQGVVVAVTLATVFGAIGSFLSNDK